MINIRRLLVFCCCISVLTVREVKAEERLDEYTNTTDQKTTMSEEDSMSVSVENTSYESSERNYNSELEDTTTTSSSSNENSDFSKKNDVSSSEQFTNNTKINKKLGENFNQYFLTESKLSYFRGIPTIEAGNKNSPKTNFIDVSSHNGSLSIQDYEKIKKFGITGVVVKATQSTWYQNPVFESQVKNAISAGLKVSVYHYAEYTDYQMAMNEADYFSNMIIKAGLSKSINMVIDIEESKMRNGWLEFNTKYFKDKLNSLGFNNVKYYTSASWLKPAGGELNPNVLGPKNFWIAQYPYNVSANMNWNSNYSAWQWSPQYYISGLTGGTKVFDINQDYHSQFSYPENSEPVDSGNMYYFKNSLTSGEADIKIAYGRASDIAYFGDWNGDNKDTFVVRRSNTYYFKNSYTSGEADFSIAYGRPDDEVFFGDWDGDGKDGIAVKRGNMYYFKNNILIGGTADYVIGYGQEDDTSYFGDWNGDGKDTIGVRRGNTFYFKNSNQDGTADIVVSYGNRDDTIYTGDWNGDSKSGLIVRRSNVYHIKNDLSVGGEAELKVGYGRTNDKVYFGDWNGDKIDTIVVRR